MAKSRETYSKKEKEKKRLKKKQEKEEKKELRKANAGKDQDMFAYVDENGNLTSTPPDPSKRRAISQENIQISIPKQEDIDTSDILRRGTVTFFNESKGYGFIRDHETQESVFVHIKALTEAIKERDKVTYKIEMTPKGPSAIDVKLD